MVYAPLHSLKVKEELQCARVLHRDLTLLETTGIYLFRGLGTVSKLLHGSWGCKWISGAEVVSLTTESLKQEQAADRGKFKITQQI